MTLKYSFQLICFLWLIEPLKAIPSLAKPGCNDTCGLVTIPYPFGIGAGCFLNEWYEVLCLDDQPYLKKYYGQKYRVVDVSLNQLTISIIFNNSIIHVCGDKGFWLGSDWSESPFSYYFYNQVVLVGCGNILLSANQTTLRGCTSACDQQRDLNGCYGINCCEITIPHNLQRIYLSFTTLEISSYSCAYVTLGSYRSHRGQFSDPSFLEEPILSWSPVVLRWTIPNFTIPESQNKPNCFSDEYRGYHCECPEGTEGNPYITNGCKGISSGTNGASTSNSRKRLIVLIVGWTSLGMLSLITSSYLLYKAFSRRRERKLKEKIFKRNGGLLLQQQLSVDNNTIDRVRLFTATDLNKATNYFNEIRVLGHGGQGTVYKGMLVDGKIIAVKKSKLVDKDQLEQFINEIVVLSQINHRNVVKLLGCCLETEVPLLVYEFIPNGTLYDLIHNENDEFLISWDMRLRIATEVAGVLAYLHSATSVPVYHRDIKSSNILLDEKYRVKVSDFGISRYIEIDQTHLTTIVKGTIGYLDPEYSQSSQFTEKSDVYSFGVVLVELLTRQKPISSSPTKEESCLSLAARFLKYMEEQRLHMILDSQILETASNEQVTAVAKLAERCLSLDGKERPTMKEVAIEFESLKMPRTPSTGRTSFQGESSLGVGMVNFSDDSFLSTIASDTVTS